MFDDKIEAGKKEEEQSLRMKTSVLPSREFAENLIRAHGGARQTVIIFNPNDSPYVFEVGAQQAICKEGAYRCSKTEELRVQALAGAFEHWRINQPWPKSFYASALSREDGSACTVLLHGLYTEGAFKELRSFEPFAYRKDAQKGEKYLDAYFTLLHEAAHCRGNIKKLGANSEGYADAFATLFLRKNALMSGDETEIRGTMEYLEQMKETRGDWRYRIRSLIGTDTHYSGKSAMEWALKISDDVIRSASREQLIKLVNKQFNIEPA